MSPEDAFLTDRVKNNYLQPKMKLPELGKSTCPKNRNLTTAVSHHGKPRAICGFSHLRFSLLMTGFTLATGERRRVRWNLDGPTNRSGRQSSSFF